MSASKTSPATCNLCEASCGIVVEHDATTIKTIRPDTLDPLSQGHICPKATALGDLQRDPDRLRDPISKSDNSNFEPIGWEHALDSIADRIASIQKRHGPDSVAFYLGNPTVHNYGAALYGLLFRQVLGGKSFFTANSVDGLPRILASYLMYGSQALIPVPDIDRTDWMLIIGANPIVSGGSIMTAPGFGKRLKALRARGGKLVVIDPRRTETAAVADAYHAIRPGSDALLLAALLHTIFEQDNETPARLAPWLSCLDELKAAASDFSPERVAAAVGIEAATIRALAGELCEAERAVCYGRMGVSTQIFGTLCNCLIDCLNIVSGNFDRAGGAMFGSPAVDLAGLAAKLGQTGTFARYRSRAGGLPEFNSELPVAALADEIETFGDGKIRALITVAGNPVLSLPNGRRLDKALSKLELMVSVDLYLNETTRHADYILPASIGLERDHYDVVLRALAVRNNAKYSPALFEPPAGVRHDWEILLELSTRLLARRGLASSLASKGLAKLLAAGPRALLAGLLRFGPRGRKLGREGLSLERLEQHPHGLDLGPLEPRLPALLRGGKIMLLPAQLRPELERLTRSLDQTAAIEDDEPSTLALIGRRLLHSNNSWMHNISRLNKGADRCVLLIHPDDAAARGITTDSRVELRSKRGAITVPAKLSDEMTVGVVSLPHGFGHDRPGSRLNVAARQPGASINDLMDDAAIDTLSGCTSFCVRVEVRPIG